MTPRQFDIWLIGYLLQKGFSRSLMDEQRRLSPGFDYSEIGQNVLDVARSVDMTYPRPAFQSLEPAPKQAG